MISPDGVGIFRQRGEPFLLAGLLVWCLAFAPYFPVLLLAGQLFAGPVALILLFIGAWQSCRRSASVLRIVLSLLLFLIALIALYSSSLQTATLMHRIFPPPDETVRLVTRDWTLTFATALASALLWYCWLRSWTDWPRLRCLMWGGVVIGLHVLIAAGFWLILLTDPPRTS